MHNISHCASVSPGFPLWLATKDDDCEQKDRGVCVGLHKSQENLTAKQQAEENPDKASAIRPETTVNSLPAVALPLWSTT